MISNQFHLPDKIILFCELPFHSRNMRMLYLQELAFLWKMCLHGSNRASSPIAISLRQIGHVLSSCPCPGVLLEANVSGDIRTSGSASMAASVAPFDKRTEIRKNTRKIVA